MVDQLIQQALTFWLTDVVSEIWGRRRASLMVVWGFLMSLLMLAVLQLAIALPPSEFWGSESISERFGFAADNGILDHNFGDMLF